MIKVESNMLYFVVHLGSSADPGRGIYMGGGVEIGILEF